MKIIGILGGLGPKTTAELYLKIVNSKELKDYPNILISNVCFRKGIDKDIIQNKEDTCLMLPPVLNSIDQLKRAGAEIIILPCNTLGNLVPEIISKRKITLLTPVEETCKKLNYLNVKNIGLIATSKTKELQIYEQKLPDKIILYPSQKDQVEIDSVINRIILNEIKKEDKLFLKEIINQFKDNGCEKVILGCTDLSNLIKEDGFVLDSFETLLKQIILTLKDN